MVGGARRPNRPHRPLRLPATAGGPLESPPPHAHPAPPRRRVLRVRGRTGHAGAGATLRPVGRGGTLRSCEAVTKLTTMAYSQ
jgi:hypothetical protein